MKRDYEQTREFIEDFLHNGDKYDIAKINDRLERSIVMGMSDSYLLDLIRFKRYAMNHNEKRKK